MFLNFLSFFTVYIIFFISIYSYGSLVTRLIFKNIKFNFGETGLFGFVFIYLIVTLFHFFSAINIFLSSLFFLIGLVNFYFVCHQNKLSEIKNDKYFPLSFLFFVLIACTNNHHDDLYIFILPIINYMQEYKIVFGLINLNDYIGQGHSLFEIMSLFRIPIIENRAYFLIPIIFFHFFVIFLIDSFKKNKSYILQNFIFFLVLLISLRFNRSKEFGTDLPVLCTIFYIQYNVFRFVITRDISLFIKSSVIMIFGIILKIYSFVSIFYILIFFIFLKKDFFLVYVREKLITLFIFFLILFTLIKNIIVSGCLIYPIKNLCFEKSVIGWSISKEIAYKRNVHYSAQVKGWKSFTRNLNDGQFIKPKDYLNLDRITHLRALVSDPDFDKILSGFIITLMSIFIMAISNGKKIKFIENKYKKITFLLLSLMPLLFWANLFPQSRYGYYAYISFFLISFFYFFNTIAGISRRVFFSFFVLAICFVTFKNLSRIVNEVKIIDHNYYPIKKFRVSKEKVYKVNNINVKIPINSRLECANIKMLCASYIESLSNIKIIFGYYFVENNPIGILMHLNKSATHDMIEMND